MTEIVEQKIVSGCKNPFRTFYIAVMHYGVWPVSYTHLLNRLIKEIVVHEHIDSDKTRHISIEIHFNLKPIPEVEQVTA